MLRSFASSLALVFLVAASPAAAQAPASAPAGRTAFNTVYLELGGNGLVYSINYERMLPSSMALRVGLSYMSLTATATGGGGTGSANASFLGIPVTFSYLAGGAGSLKFEVGAGATLVRFSGSASLGFGEDVTAGVVAPVGTAIAGLRIAPPGGGFNFRLVFTPFFGPGGFTPWGGLGLGMSF